MGSKTNLYKFYFLQLNSYKLIIIQVVHYLKLTIDKLYQQFKFFLLKKKLQFNYLWINCNLHEIN